MGGVGGLGGVGGGVDWHDASCDMKAIAAMINANWIRRAPMITHIGAEPIPGIHAVSAAVKHAVA